MSRIMNVGDDARRLMATVKRLNSIAVCNAHGYANSNLHPTLKRSNTNSTLSESMNQLGSGTVGCTDGY